MLHVDYTERGHTPAGTRRSLSAAKVAVLGANDKAKHQRMPAVGGSA
ncbi:hypothetical protein AB0942_28835 [Streptomyces nodosus]